MDVNYQTCLEFLMQDGYAAPSWGICQAEYDAWRHLLGLPQADVAKMPRTELVAIYRQQYWVPECPALLTGTDYLVFDLKAKVGPYLATKCLQDALALDSDGHFGIITMDKVRSADVKKLNDTLLIAKADVLGDKAPQNLQPKTVHGRVLTMLGTPA